MPPGRAFFSSLLLLLILLLFSGCHGSYLISQAGGEVRLLASVRTIPEVLADPTQPPHRAENLQELSSILSVAEEVGLEVGDAYNSVANQEGPVTWIVVAVKPGDIELYRWNFPIVGEVPYKGWFRESGARREAVEMERRGYDVAVLPVPAFSTLGWFSDPLMPIQLDASIGEFAEVVFHELVHRSCHFSGDAGLSESLATYLGEHLARRWLQERFGEGSSRHRRYIDLLSDRAQVRSVVAAAREELEKSQQQGLLDGAGQRGRQVLEELEGRLAGLSLLVVDRERLSRSGWSIPRLLLSHLYRADEALLEAVFSAQEGDIGEFLRWMQSLEGLTDPRGELQGVFR